PNLFFSGLQEAWRHHLTTLWKTRAVELPDGVDPASLIVVPEAALYYACLGCVEIGQDEAPEVGVYLGGDRLRWWIEEGQHEQKAQEGARGLVENGGELSEFRASYERTTPKPAALACEAAAPRPEMIVGCDFGSTTAKAVVLAPDGTLVFSCYVLSRGNPIEDAKDLFAQMRAAGLDG